MAGGDNTDRREVLDELTRQASNLQRYPFESATMNEAARMAADALRNIRRNLAAKWGSA